MILYREDSPTWRVGAEVLVVPREALGGRNSRELDRLDTDGALPRRIQAMAPGPKGRQVVRFSHVGSRSDAEKLKGAVIGIPEDSLGELEEGEFWYHEVPGWQVRTVDGDKIGEVVRVMDLHTTLFEVRPLGGGPTFYIPLIPDVVVGLDRVAGEIVIDPLDGLLP